MERGEGEIENMNDVNKCPKEDLYVYQGTVDGVIVYVGMGSIDRSDHLNSGVSHVYEANKSHFSGAVVDVTILETFSDRKDAMSYEMDIIRKEQPLWNTVGTNKLILRNSIKTACSRFKKFSSLHGLLILASDCIGNDYKITFDSKTYLKFTGQKCSSSYSKFNQAKTQHKVIDKFDRVSKGVYEIKFRECFIDRIETETLCSQW